MGVPEQTVVGEFHVGMLTQAASSACLQADAVFTLTVSAALLLCLFLMSETV